MRGLGDEAQQGTLRGRLISVNALAGGRRGLAQFLLAASWPSLSVASETETCVRVRIVRAHHGEVDGVPVADLVVGRTYDLAASIATYLIVMGSAEPVVDQALRFRAGSRQRKEFATTTGGPWPVAVAADRPARVRDSRSRIPTSDESTSVNG